MGWIETSCDCPPGFCFHAGQIIVGLRYEMAHKGDAGKAIRAAILGTPVKRCTQCKQKHPFPKT
jgi:hypothetical protein